MAAFPVERPRADRARRSGQRRDADGGRVARASSTRRRPASSSPTSRCSTRRRSRTIPTGCSDALDDGAHLVLTDTNRRQARRWGTVRENVGYTERAGEEALEDDPTDNRLELFPGAGRRRADRRRAAGRGASRRHGYGNPVSLTPDDRPAQRARRRPAHGVARRRVLGRDRRTLADRARRTR